MLYLNELIGIKPLYDIQNYSLLKDVKPGWYVYTKIDRSKGLADFYNHLLRYHNGKGWT